MKLGAVLATLVLTACGGGAATNGSSLLPKNVPSDSDKRLPTHISSGTGGLHFASVSPVSFEVFGQAVAGLTHISAHDVGALLAFQDASGTKHLYAYQSNRSRAAILVEEGPNAHVATVVERVGASTVPISGTATYTGTYAGLLTIGGTTPSVARSISGDVSLSADFDVNSIKGDITNRQLHIASTFAPDTLNALTDATLINGAFDENGQFTGTVSGGEITNSIGWTQAQGHYDGLFAGPAAAEVTGTVALSHQSLDGTVRYSETGIFAAQ